MAKRKVVPIVPAILPDTRRYDVYVKVDENWVCERRNLTRDVAYALVKDLKDRNWQTDFRISGA